VKTNRALFIFLVLVSFGCQQSITLELPKYDDKVAVYCVLIPGVRTQLYLNLSKSYYQYGDTTGDPRFIKNATVTITNTTDNIIDVFKLDSIHTSYYFYIGKYDVLPGKHYVLDVRYNGKVINAETTVPLPIEIDHYTYTKVKQGGTNGKGYIDFDMYIRDRPGEKDAYVFGNDDSRTYTTDLGQDGEMMDVHVKWNIPSNFNINGTFWINGTVTTATRVTGTYLNDLKTQANASKNPFATPVVLQSNINGGIGIFGSATNSKQHFITVH
jgi:hypothetical protein